ncbi:Uncharacterised protein [uncultured archaeon]|nr:Uncharacterised protein [uncultured archaeon]
MKLPSLSFAISETSRIIRLTRKPKQSEFWETAKITGAGMIIIGTLGFIVILVAQVLRG